MGATRRRVHAELTVLGHRVSPKRVWRLMRQADPRGRHPRAWRRTTVPGLGPIPAPDLIGRAFSADEQDRKWCGDITYIRTWQGWMYLATVIDLHSRRVVGWVISDHMRTGLVIDALDMAVRLRRPDGVIFHSDRGCPYTSSPSSRTTARRTIFNDPSGGPGYVSTIPSPSHSSPPTRRNSSTTVPGPP